MLAARDADPVSFALWSGTSNALFLNVDFIG